MKKDIEDGIYIWECGCSVEINNSEIIGRIACQKEEKRYNNYFIDEPASSGSYAELAISEGTLDIKKAARYHRHPSETIGIIILPDPDKNSVKNKAITLPEHGCGLGFEYVIKRYSYTGWSYISHIKNPKLFFSAKNKKNISINVKGVCYLDNNQTVLEVNIIDDRIIEVVTFFMHCHDYTGRLPYEATREIVFQAVL